MTLIQSEMSVSEVASLLCVTAPRSWRIFDYWLAQATADEDLSEVSQLGIDETSSKKGHKYITVFVDMENRNVIEVQAGKDSKTITNFVEHLESQGGDRNRIENVCMYSPITLLCIVSFLEKQIVFRHNRFRCVRKFKFLRSILQVLDLPIICLSAGICREYEHQESV